MARTPSRAWSAREHADFVRGLEVFGKGKWKQIADRFVKTRTATQVASHAQKYFIRLDRARGEEGTGETTPPPSPVALDAETFAQVVSTTYWACLAHAHAPKGCFVPTHEIRKPIPRRDVTHVISLITQNQCYGNF